LTVNNLPEGYAVKSMSYGSTNLLTDTLKLTDSNFSQLQTLNSSPGSAGIIVLAMNCTVLPAANGASVPSTSGPCMTGTANSSVIITLAANAVSAPPVSGARISGKMLFQSGDWAIYSDSVPGILYADGTFEIRGVTPGRVVRTSIAFISTFGVTEAGDRIVPPTAKASALIFVSERTLDSRIVFWICGSNSWRMAGVAGATIIVLPSTACQKLFVCSEEPGHNSWTSDIRLQFNLVSHRPSSGVRCGRSITITSSGMPRS
jgi:hypothetical protein